MEASTPDWLCCPVCKGNLSSSGIGQGLLPPGYDILTCLCGRYPVVAGIPIVKKGPARIMDRVLALLEAGRHREALLVMVTPASPGLAPVWLQSLPRFKGVSRLKHLAHLWALRAWREQAAALLTNPGGQVTAGRLYDFYYRRRVEARDYLYCRFGQPRHLIALSFVSLIHQAKKPILDLACGSGHITRSLVQQAKGQPVIGVDQSFFELYMAKHWIAPGAKYVCCTANASLPFADGFFSTAFCSDAFQYFADKAAVMRELKRLTQPNGLIMVVGTRNLLVRTPYYGLPLPPEGYQALVAEIPHRLVDDGDVLVRYREKQGPLLARPVDIERLVHAPMLSLVASHRQEVFQDYGPFEDWPHADGRLGLNPLFAVGERNARGNVQLRRTFPSTFYEADHAPCKDYLPETVDLPSEAWTHLTKGNREPALESLIDQCVVLGMPEQYRYDGL